MSSARPLHELLADLVGDPDAARAHGDPDAYLAANGHPDLPSELVAEAVVSYADTAPVEVAEHLAPYVTTHSTVPSTEQPADNWFDLLTTAPTEDTAPDLDGVPDEEAAWSPEGDPGPGLDFGTGSTDVLDEPSAPATDDTPETAAEPAPEAAWPDLEPELDTTPAPTTQDQSDDTDDPTTPEPPD